MDGELYAEQPKIKKMLKSHGLTIKDLARAFNEAPMTTSHRVNGWLPWKKKHTKKAHLLIESVAK